MDTSLIWLGIANVRNKSAESLYLKFGLDITRPTQIYGLVNRTCNAKCKMCDIWRSDRLGELPAAIWIKGLKSLKSFVGTFNINFSGGEPLLKKDFFDILEYCTKEKIIAGFTTNGLLLNRKNVHRILDLDLFNINISLDSMENSIHDEVRGIPGLLAKIKENISYLVAQKQKLRKKLRIILKPTVYNMNLKGLDKIVEYAEKMNLTGVNFQPIFKRSKESENMFKINQNELITMIDTLIEMKKKGCCILNSEASIRQWVLHFNEEIPERNSPCVVALRNLNINPKGEVFLCSFRDSIIGNIKSGDIKEMWYSKKTGKLRKVLVNCKKLCTATCVVKRSWKDYIQLFFRLIRS